MGLHIRSPLVVWRDMVRPFGKHVSRPSDRGVAPIGRRRAKNVPPLSAAPDAGIVSGWAYRDANLPALPGLKHDNSLDRTRHVQGGLAASSFRHGLLAICPS